MKKILPWGALVLGICALGCFIRLFLGVDLTDESHYGAIPYSVINGAVPFLNEHGHTQTAGFLMYPFLRLFVALVGGSQGIVLFIRLLFFCTSILQAFVVYRVSRRLGGSRNLSALLSALSLTFVPHCVASFSYNTLAVFGLTTGLMLYWAAYSVRRPARYFAAAVLVQGLAAVAYPTVALVCVVAATANLFWAQRVFSKSDFVECRNLCLALLTLFGIAAVALASAVGLTQLRAVASYYEVIGQQFGTISKIRLIAQQSLPMIVESVGVFLTIVLVLTVDWMKRPGRWLAGLICTAAIGAFYYGYAEFGIQHLIIIIGLLPLVFILPETPPASRLQWSLSAFAALVCGWTSGAGVLSVGNAAIFGVLINFFEFARYLNARHRECEKTWAPRRAFFFLLLTAMTLGQLLGYYRFFYRDGPLTHLGVLMREGPYCGLRTTPEKAQFLHQVAEDLRAIERPGGTIVFFDDFPAGYYFTKMRPLSPTNWILSTTDRRALYRQWILKFYDRPSRLPDYVFWIWTFPESDGRPFAVEPEYPHPIGTFFLTHGYHVILKKRQYMILQRDPGPPA